MHWSMLLTPNVTTSRLDFLFLFFYLPHNILHNAHTHTHFRCLFEWAIVLQVCRVQIFPLVLNILCPWRVVKKTPYCFFSISNLHSDPSSLTFQVQDKNVVFKISLCALFTKNNIKSVMDCIKIKADNIAFSIAT